MKRKIYLFVLIAGFIVSCTPGEQKPGKTYMEIRGATQGTTYMIKYSTPDTTNYRPEIEKILAEIDTSLSTYNKQSVITKINRNQTTKVQDSYFQEVFTTAMQISEETQGAFDITVAPLVNAWGFGFEEIPQVDSTHIDSIMQFVGYEKVAMNDGNVYKDDERIMLDMNAIAQGYTVDVLVRFFNDKGLKDYLVEVGGEVRTRGKNPDARNWRVGIDKPLDSMQTKGRELEAIIELNDKSLATSGNYRKFYVKDGVKYSHTINPETGYPVRHNLLSVTVLAEECIRADAYATAFMVMGLERSLELVNKTDNLEAFFIYSDQNGYFKVMYSDNIKKLITHLE
jgi:thiamine biosynthesis lipoprotein